MCISVTVCFKSNYEQRTDSTPKTWQIFIMRFQSGKLSHLVVAVFLLTFSSPSSPVTVLRFFRLFHGILYLQFPTKLAQHLTLLMLEKSINKIKFRMILFIRPLHTLIHFLKNRLLYECVTLFKKGIQLGFFHALVSTLSSPLAIEHSEVELYLMCHVYYPIVLP